MSSYIYPQANSIYYDRKVEFTNLLQEKLQQDRKKYEFLLERSRLNEESKKQMQEAMDRLRQLME